MSYWKASYSRPVSRGSAVTVSSDLNKPKQLWIPAHGLDTSGAGPAGMTYAGLHSQNLVDNVLVGCLAYNLLHMIRYTAFRGQSVRPSIDSIIRRCSEIAKTSLIGLSLAPSIAKLYGFAGLRVFPEVFGAESGPKMGLGCILHKLMHYSGSGSFIPQDDTGYCHARRICQRIRF